MYSKVPNRAWIGVDGYISCFFWINYEAGDSRREQFRRYLEKGGVLDTLTKVLVALYEEPEKPNNAMDFLKQHLGTVGPETADVETLRLEVTELRQKYELLLEENKELKAKLAQFESPKEEGQPE
ncbi:C-Myc-binding protein [Heterodontus francisci]|uniref:C-Myc-binding protein n=1 Tax=Heterodontus francisci TaxID=7792 RepID=UPI00355C7CCB